MTSLSRRTLLTATAAVSATTLLTNSPLASLAFAAEAKDGWTEIFDGKSLKGWHKNPEKIGHGTGGIWEVQEGAIVGYQDPPGSGNGGILLTDEKYGDFELQIDLKPSWGVCSGLFLRANDKGQCLQMMVDYHDAGNVGQIYGEGTGGFNTRTFDVNGIYDASGKHTGFKTDKHKTAAEVGLVSACTPEEWVKAWKIDDWNTAHVVVSGKYAHISTTINGLKVCEWNGETSKSERYDKEATLKALTAAGSIAVQVHGGKNWPVEGRCRWKNIRVKKIG